MRWLDWYSEELDEHNERKLKDDTPDDIKKEYEEYKRRKKEDFEKRGLIY